MSRTRKKVGAVPAINKPKMEYLDIYDISPYDNNPRDNTEAVKSVANSISEFGFLGPIIIDRDSTIIAGHTRYAAATSLGYTEVPVIRATNLTEEQIAQFRIIDNKVAELARWDVDALAQEITALEKSGIDFTMFGFQQAEIDCLSDIVADDCLEASHSLGEDIQPRHADPRAPTQARVVISEFVFFLPMDVYKRWAREVRTCCDFEESKINNLLQERLGITPYLEASGED